MSGLASYRLLRYFVILIFIGTFLAALAGCATTSRPPSNAQSYPDVGISIVSRPPDTLLVSIGGTFKSTTESSGSIGFPKGWESFGPGALLLVPFALAYDALRSPVKAESDPHQCEAKLNSNYPQAAVIIRDAVQREFVPDDVLLGFIDAPKHPSRKFVVVTSQIEPRDAPATQQLLDAAAHRGLARLLVIEVLSAELVPLNAGCEQWALSVGLRVSLWNIADGKRIGGPVLAYPYVNADLSNLQTVMEEPGAIRSSLALKFRYVAGDIFAHGLLFR